MTKTPRYYPGEEYRLIQAKFASTCAWCNGEIAEGEQEFFFLARRVAIHTDAALCEATIRARTAKPASKVTAQERTAVEILAAAAARFLASPRRYKRDSDGSYQHAWTGTRLVARIGLASRVSDAQREALGGLMDGETHDLYWNGKFLGTLSAWVPYAYPDQELYLDLADEYCYNQRALVWFAKKAGYAMPADYDHSLLEVAHETDKERAARIERDGGGLVF